MNSPPQSSIIKRHPDESCYQPHHILVTGGAGFIGSNFIRLILETYSDVNIVNLDLLTYAGRLSNLDNLPDDSRHTFCKGDICNRELVDQLLGSHRIDTIIHFAAESHVDRSITGPSVFIQTNIFGTFTLLEAARTFWLEENKWGAEECRFHHISTDEVYGSLGKTDPPFSETTPYTPNSPYSASKASSDHLVRAYHHTYGLPTTTTNCSNNYGPCQHVEKFIPTVIRSCVRQVRIPVYGDGSNIRDWLYVADHCQGIDTVVRHGRIGESYNIGGGNEWNNISIARLICSLMDEFRPEGSPHESLIQFVTDRPGHDWRYAIDPRRIQNELGWLPADSFKTGLRKTIEWYLEGDRLE